MQHTVKLRDYSRLVAEFGVEAPRRGRKAMFSAATRGMKRSVLLTSKGDRKPVDRGAYRRGWRVRRHPDGAVLYNPVSYAPIVEAGSRPHWAPLQPLIEWVVRKGLSGGKARSSEILVKRAGRMNKQGRLTKGAQRSGMRLFEAVEIARRIRFKIAKKGTKGHWILKRASRRFKKYIHEEIKSELRRI